MAITLHKQPDTHATRGLWVASCATCGHELCTRASQQAAETIGNRTRCPVCGTRTATRRHR